MCYDVNIIQQEEKHTMICSKCGTELALNTRICPNCGKPQLLTPLKPISPTQEDIKEVIIEETTEGEPHNLAEEKIISQLDNNTLDTGKSSPVIEYDEAQDNIEEEIIDDELLDMEEQLEDELDEGPSSYESETVSESIEEMSEEIIEDIDENVMPEVDNHSEENDFEAERMAVNQKYADIPDYTKIDTNKDGYYDSVMPDIEKGLREIPKQNYILAVAIVILTALFIFLVYRFIL